MCVCEREILSGSMNTTDAHSIVKLFGLWLMILHPGPSAGCPLSGNWHLVSSVIMQHENILQKIHVSFLNLRFVLSSGMCLCIKMNG